LAKFAVSDRQALGDLPQVTGMHLMQPEAKNFTPAAAVLARVQGTLEIGSCGDRIQ
jgi:hypothetical protein